MRILRELGYVENQNFDIVYRSSGGNQDRLPTLAEELAQLKPDVILAIAIAAAVLARKATSTNRDGRLRPRRRRPPFRLRIAVSRATALNYTGDAIGSICDRRCGWGARPALFAGIAGAFDRPHNNQNTLGRSIMIDSVEKTTIRKVYVRLLPLLFVAYFIWRKS